MEFPSRSWENHQIKKKQGNFLAIFFIFFVVANFSCEMTWANYHDLTWRLHHEIG